MATVGGRSIERVGGGGDRQTSEETNWFLCTLYNAYFVAVIGFRPTKLRCYNGNFCTVVHGNTSLVTNLANCNLHAFRFPLLYSHNVYTPQAYTDM